MAIKRKNTISDSLKKKGKELNLEEMKKKVQELHIEETPQEPKKEPIVRLSVDAPESVYLALKGKILRNRTTIKKHVLQLIKKDLDM